MSLYQSKFANEDKGVGEDVWLQTCIKPQFVCSFTLPEHHDHIQDAIHFWGYCECFECAVAVFPILLSLFHHLHQG